MRTLLSSHWLADLKVPDMMSAVGPALWIHSDDQNTHNDDGSRVDMASFEGHTSKRLETPDFNFLSCDSLFIFYSAVCLFVIIFLLCNLTLAVMYHPHLKFNLTAEVQHPERFSVLSIFILILLLFLSMGGIFLVYWGCVRCCSEII